MDMDNEGCAWLFVLAMCLAIGILMGGIIGSNNRSDQFCTKIATAYNVKANLINDTCYLQVSGGANYSVDDFLKKYATPVIP